MCCRRVPPAAVSLMKMARRIIGGLATVALALGLLGLGSMQRVTTQDRRFDPTRAELESLRRENDALRKQLRQSETLGRGCRTPPPMPTDKSATPTRCILEYTRGRERARVGRGRERALHRRLSVR